MPYSSPSAHRTRTIRLSTPRLCWNPGLAPARTAFPHEGNGKVSCTKDWRILTPYSPPREAYRLKLLLCRPETTLRPECKRESRPSVSRSNPGGTCRRSIRSQAPRYGGATKSKAPSCIASKYSSNSPNREDTTTWASGLVALTRRSTSRKPPSGKLSSQNTKCTAGTRQGVASGATCTAWACQT
jgi:hypothetical protein